MPKNLLSIEDAAKKYQFRRDTILSAALKGTIESEERDGVWFVSDSAIGELIEQRDSAVYTADDTAKILGVSPKTVRRYIKEGTLIATRVGGQWRIRAKDVQDYMDGSSHRESMAKSEQELISFFRGDASPISGSVQGCLILNIKSESAEHVEDLRNEIVYILNNKHAGPLSSRYDWIEESHIARFMFYDTPKTLAALIFDTFEKLNAFEA